ncbi:DUF7529 family protein [Halomarina litorea]|uniref:DUF7529 family protein n=1 Tax=Halomarina litorea TaxID=2961595 RepID=UPI0020C33EC1|nr:hypothetical protein [Halomarina sp. BCD28]
MPETGGDRDYADEIASNADVLKGAWQATIGEMRAMGEELEADGWSVTTVGADHTAPEPPDVGRSGRFGLVYVVPDNYAREVRRAIAAAADVDVDDLDTDEPRELDAFGRYEVFRNESSGNAFQVTALYDDDSKTALLVAGSYELRHAPPLMKAALERGEMYTHIQTLDETPVGSFYHDDWELFFPNARQRLGLVEGETPDED